MKEISQKVRVYAIIEAQNLDNSLLPENNTMWPYEISEKKKLFSLVGVTKLQNLSVWNY